MKAQTGRVWVTVAMAGAIFLTAISSSIVTTAAPSITGALGGIELFSWVFSSYLLTATIVTPLCGKLADLYGRKPVYMVGVGLFLVGSLLCGLAQSMEQLIVFRLAQGLGAGAIQPIALTLAGDLYPPAERPKIQGIFSAMWGLSSLIGPPIGGFLVAALGWRWVFWFNVPLGIAAALVMAVALHEVVERRRHQLDFLGAGILAASVSAFMLGLFEIGGTGTSSPFGAGPMLLLAVGLLAAFLWWETRAPEPILPLSLFRLRVVSAGAALSFIGGVAIMGMTAHIALFAQGVLGGTPVQAGLAILPIDIFWLVASMFSGRFLVRYGCRRAVLVGSTVLAASAFATSRLDGSVSILQFALVAGPCGFGLGFLVSPIIIAMQNAVGWAQRGVVTGANVFFRSIGGGVGMAVLGVVLNAQLIGLLGAAALSPASDGAVAAERPGRGAVQVTAVAQLLDPDERAALPPATESLLASALGQSLQGVFLLIALAAFIGIALVPLLPDERLEDQSRVLAQSPAAEAASPGTRPAARRGIVE